MATNNLVNNGLAGTTGTGEFVGSTSPTIATATLSSPTMTTPTLGAATATSVTFSPTTGGNIGTTTNNNASSGIVGEFVSSNVAFGSAISLSTMTNTDVTSISLTAGDWDVWGNIYIAASATTLTNVRIWSSLTSATLPNSSLINQFYDPTAVIQYYGASIPYLRVSIASTSSVYLSLQVTFASGSVTGCGGIYARRAR